MLSLDLFKDWEKLHVSIAMMLLFACALHNNNEVKLYATPAQHHNDINEINEQDGRNELNK